MAKEFIIKHGTIINGDIDATGDVTATYYRGNGSLLDGVNTETGVNITILVNDEGAGLRELVFTNGVLTSANLL